jgi:energy-coupling factor transporter ATP-binding protein EcfA2
MELFSDIHRQGNTVILVTHNPELTRYANRVIYMQDGRIIGDERTEIGEVAKGARYSHYRKHKKTDTDIVAGVSALMHKVPAKELEEKPKNSKMRKRGRPKKAKS